MSDLKANTASAPSTAPAPTAADTQIVSPAANLASLPSATSALTPAPTPTVLLPLSAPLSAPQSAPLSAPQSAPLPSTETEVAKTLQQAETAAQVAAAAAQQAADAAANVAALASALTSDTPLNPELTPPHEPPASAFAISGLSYNSNDAQVDSELEHQELDVGTAAAHSPAASPAAAPTMVTDESAWANLQTAHQDAGGALESDVGDDHLAAFLDEVHDGLGRVLHGGHLLRQVVAQGVAAQGDDDAFTHSWCIPSSQVIVWNLSDSFGGNACAIPAKTENFKTDQNSFRLPPWSRAISAETGSFTLLIRIMAAMM